jgi:fatty-acyl-CoA synthase
MPGNLVRILDEDLNEVPRGEVGEICFRSPNTMVEYWKRPDETAATLRGGWLHTGDMARMDARGFIYIVDRSKDMIVTGGFNVFPREVEDVLTAHPAVAMAAVIGVPDPKWGEAVMGIVVLRSDATADEAELIAHVKQAKGSVQTPKSIVFAEELPVTGLGKPDKKALRAQYWKDQDRQVG